MFCVEDVKQTLSKALRTQALTASTSSFGLIWWVGFGMFGSVGLLSSVWFHRFSLVALVWYVWFGKFGLVGLAW